MRRPDDRGGVRRAGRLRRSGERSALDAPIGETCVAEIPAPLWRTIQLAVLVSTSAAVIGTAAGLVDRAHRSAVPPDVAGRARAAARPPLVRRAGGVHHRAGAGRDDPRRPAGAVGVTPPRRFRGLGAIVARPDRVHLPVRAAAGVGPAGAAARRAWRRAPGCSVVRRPAGVRQRHPPRSSDRRSSAGRSSSSSTRSASSAPCSCSDTTP